MGDTEVSPWRMALRDDTALPAADFGPVEALFLAMEIQKRAGFAEAFLGEHFESHWVHGRDEGVELTVFGCGHLDPADFEGDVAGFL